MSHLNYYRESPQYFNKWSDLCGIKNWSYEEVLPYFMKAENYLDSDASQTHGTGGPITVSTVSPDPVLRRYLIAAEMLGFNQSSADGSNPFGASLMQRTVTKEGIALSTSSAYIESKPRPNLSTIGNSFVTRILFDRSNQAIGVNFQKDGSSWTLKARKEIIICAGVVGKQLVNFSVNKNLFCRVSTTATAVGNRTKRPFAPNEHSSRLQSQSWSQSEAFARCGHGLRHQRPKTDRKASSDH